MTKRPYFRLGVGLIVAGVALIALNIWFLTTVPSIQGPAKAKLALGGLGMTVLVIGVMVLRGD